MAYLLENYLIISIQFKFSIKINILNDNNDNNDNTTKLCQTLFETDTIN